MNEPGRVSDTEITDLLRRRSARPAPDELASAVLESLASEREFHPGRAKHGSRMRPMVLLAAAALLLVGGALAAGSELLRRPAVVPPVPAPSLVAVATASPNASVPNPSQLASAIPTAGPITWTQASLKQDWPVPVRTEPAGRPILVPILYLKKDILTCCKPDAGHLADPAGDTGSDPVPWGDINNVALFHTGVDVDFVPGQPGRGVDPRQVWFGRGLVVDTDGDGVADWRYGMDNVPAGTPSHCDGSSYDFRWWRTDLHTGRTDWQVCYTLEGPAPDGVPTGSPYPIVMTAVGEGPAHLRLSFGSDTPAGETGTLPKGRFYAWASVIQDGRVVATDYAPDAGWLVPSPNAKP
jgi:hypothetical protein